MGWITRILRWRPHQPALIRWLEATGLFLIALAIRYSLGSLSGAAPFISFYPALLVSSVLLGWKEAMFVLVLSLAAAHYFFLPPSLSLLPVAYGLVATLNVAIIIALKSLAERLAEANERQQVLFEELQHRTANTLQIIAGTLESIRKKLSSGPDECANTLDTAIQRMLTSAEMHRRLHRPELFNGLEPMLREIATATIDQASVTLDLQVEELDLSLDQQSIIAMLVMEIANNSAKHVFRQNLGSRFELVLQALPDHRAVLSIRDDGSGVIRIDDRAPPNPTLGIQILKGLADQLHGTLVTEREQGRKVTVNFPTLRQVSRQQRVLSRSVPGVRIVRSALGLGAGR
jgi:two-component sensor histidine kinase